MAENNFNIEGLTDKQVLLAREKFGSNTNSFKKENRLLTAIKSLAKEPMVILLLVTSLIYFISGKTGDGLFLSAAIIVVAAISLFQDYRSRIALEKLRIFTQPYCKVIRNREMKEIKSEELVIGDSLMIEEGTAIAADGIIVRSNDFSVNESILTGEPFAVYKDSAKSDNIIYTGTTVASGLAIATITAIGNNTRLSKIGKIIESVTAEKSPLELQINDFIKKMVIVGVIVFLIVWGINFFHSHNILDSLLKALTLAMSILPEEIPVAFTTFMALGAWRLLKMGIVVKQIKTVETLGSATTICVDKTGTITENKMTLAKLFLFPSLNFVDPAADLTDPAKELIGFGMWSSEPIPFDPMETALHESYARLFKQDERPGYKLIHEYPIGGKPPMMTHIFESSDGKRIIAAKGAPEALMNLSNLESADKELINTAIHKLATEGYRLLGVGVAEFSGYDFPATQQEFTFQFKGIIAFYDPPKKNIQKVFEDFQRAGISVKIITGDYEQTTIAIAKQVNFIGYEKCISGDELMKLSDQALKEAVVSKNIFTRMFPEAKLKIINALKFNNEIVAMTGDGVNDGPALKAAHIGIAMGKRGTEIAKQAASLILVEDDLSKMVDAVAEGRRIYTNLKKAIQYIISIHIPIILTVFIPLALGWLYPNIFSPVHIIFLELIMGPTCSIIYENEPMEKNTMIKPPLKKSSGFFNVRELSISILQGLLITAGTLLAYQYAISQGYNEALTRTMTFTVLIVANILLTMVNRSFYYSIITTLKYKNRMVPMIILITLAIMALLLYYHPMTVFFQFETLDFSQLFICATIGFISVIWFEIIKLIKRSKGKLE